MAAYAAYRHVELDHVGYGKKRVLKPPGGGSSDIFGAAGDAQQSPRKVKQYMASNISLTDGVPSGAGPGSTSSATSSTSSGETPPAPASPTGSPTRNGTAPDTAQQAQTQAPQAAEQAPQAAEQVILAAGKAPDGEPRGRQFQMQSHFSLGYDKPATPVKAGDEAESVVQGGEKEGNPVTGEGYGKAAGGAPGPVRNRVPPGGYSSGLW